MQELLFILGESYTPKAARVYLPRRFYESVKSWFVFVVDDALKLSLSLVSLVSPLFFRQAFGGEVVRGWTFSVVAEKRKLSRKKLDKIERSRLRENSLPPRKALPGGACGLSGWLMAWVRSILPRLAPSRYLTPLGRGASRLYYRWALWSMSANHRSKSYQIKQYRWDFNKFYIAIAFFGVFVAALGNEIAVTHAGCRLILPRFASTPFPVRMLLNFLKHVR